MPRERYTLKGFCFVRISAEFCNGIDEFFGIFPAKAGVCDRFAVNVVRTDFLASFYQVTFNHNAFYQITDIRGDQTTVEYFFYNANLLLELFAGVGVVGINDGSRICQVFFPVHIQKTLQIFVMIVGNRIAMFADGAS